MLSQRPWPGRAGSRGEGLVSTLFSSGASSASPRTRATWWICTEASGGWRMCTFTKEGFTEAEQRGWGHRWGHRAPPSKEWHQPWARWACVSPQISPPFLHSLPKPQKNFSGRTGQSTDSFIPHLPMKNLCYQLPKYLPDSTSSHDPAQPLGSSPTNPAWSPPLAFV